MFHRRKALAVVLIVLVLLAGCSQSAAPATPLPPTGQATSTLAPAQAAVTTPVPVASPAATLEPALTPTTEPGAGDLSAEQAMVLGSLAQVDSYPLYTMRYEGDYSREAGRLRERDPSSSNLGWACSLFASLGDEEEQVFGRNFDWQYSPALLLFTDPDDGYASVTMVDIAYLGFGGTRAGSLLDLPLAERRDLLAAPHWPFDGMNEHGLAVGMAAVPPGGMSPDPAKPTLDSLEIMRYILDHARDVDEALSIFGEYNIDFQGGPPLHYLLSDRSGRAVLVEFYAGEMVVIPNEQPWHLATNFLRAAVESVDGGSTKGHCWRYDRIEDALSQAGGGLDQGGALELLAQVDQSTTQWSIVYDQHSGDVLVAMGQHYDEAHTLHLPLTAGP
jgi:choloylglycine hydrolase